MAISSTHTFKLFILIYATTLILRKTNLTTLFAPHWRNANFHESKKYHADVHINKVMKYFISTSWSMNNFSQNFTWQPPPLMWPIKTVHYLSASRKWDLQRMIEMPELFILEERVKGLCDNNLQVCKGLVNRRGCAASHVFCVWNSKERD